MNREGEVLGPVPAKHPDEFQNHTTQHTSTQTVPEHNTPILSPSTSARPLSQKDKNQSYTSIKDAIQGFLAKTWSLWGTDKPNDSSVTSLKAEETALYHNKTHTGSETSIKTCSDASEAYWTDMDQKIADGIHISQQTLYDGKVYYGDFGSSSAAIQNQSEN